MLNLRNDLFDLTRPLLLGEAPHPLLNTLASPKSFTLGNVQMHLSLHSLNQDFPLLRRYAQLSLGSMPWHYHSYICKKSSISLNLCGKKNVVKKNKGNYILCLYLMRLRSIALARSFSVNGTEADTTLANTEVRVDCTLTSSEPEKSNGATFISLPIIIT